MPISQMLLPEFDMEMANTRKTIERIPDDKFEWRPHDKSFTMQQLASHLINIPAWTDMNLNQDSIDVAPAEGEAFTTPQADTTAQLLEMFDKNVAEARIEIEKASDEQMGQPWTLKAAGQDVFTMPKVAVMRTFILNHNVHHRAQLCVYLRLNDVPVPAIYGPSADEDGM